MSGSTYWENVKAEAHDLDPARDDPGRVEQRRRVKEQMLASVNGGRLAEIRKDRGLTQATMAAAIGLPRGRISQIERGEPVSLDALRTYVTGLGGRLEVVATFGSLWLTWCTTPAPAPDEAPGSAGGETPDD
ncbi:helix-turn-helix domain-containing protein [Actinoplanes subtropicus]|uniref:helix-turn-helix domain-containing protein n=1 Tax=Actinoplanes subtropicus TaxID=543632 RepID=UPI0007C53D54|nr:helix-turn-helix domain-containing protein [Actinoplanes subtropicus]